MGLVRRSILLLLVALLSLGAPVAGTALASSPPPPTTTAPAQTAPPLERSESECVGHAVQLPGCGYKPQQPGDRGGWLQWTLFGLMLVGLAFIAWRVVIGVRRGAARDA
jgi:hypothetical protein